MTRLLVILPLLVVGMMNLPDDRGMVESWEGSLQLYGNEPFTRVALITDDQERWYLDMDEQEMNQLWRDNRGRIRITGVASKKCFQGKPRNFITVKEYEWLTSSRD